MLGLAAQPTRAGAPGSHAIYPAGSAADHCGTVRSAAIPQAISGSDQWFVKAGGAGCEAAGGDVTWALSGLMEDCENKNTNEGSCGK